MAQTLRFFASVCQLGKPEMIWEETQGGKGEPKVQGLKTNLWEGDCTRVIAQGARQVVAALK